MHVTAFYSEVLKSEHVQVLNGQKEVGLLTVWILNGIWNPELQPFENQSNAHHLVFTIWNPDYLKQILNGQDYR